MEIKWRIIEIERMLDNDMVIKVTYACNVSSPNFMDRKIGEITLEGDTSSEGFIPFEDLTEEIVITWVKNMLTESGVQDIENKVIDRLNVREDKLNNKTTEKGLPWRK